MKILKGAQAFIILTDDLKEGRPPGTNLNSRTHLVGQIPPTRQQNSQSMLLRSPVITSPSTQQENSSPQLACASDTKSTHALVHKSHLSRLQHDSKQLQDIKKKMGNKIYQSTPIGHQFLGKALSILPKASHDALQDANPLMCATFAADISIPCDYKKLAQVRPSRRTYKRVIENQAMVNYTKFVSMVNKNPNIYISSDKSNSEKGGSSKATLPNLITFTNIFTRTIITFILDYDSAGDDSEDVSNTIRHRIKKLQSMMSVTLVLRGQSTDSGGRGTLESLATHLKSDDSLIFLDDCLVASCSLHNLQTAFRNAVIDVLGEGGNVAGTKTNEFKKNTMQLLHGTYNLSNYLHPKFIHSC